MNVFLSKYNWTPEYRGKGSLFAWGIGDTALLRSRHDFNKVAQVRIDSEMMKHDDAPGNGLVYEVVFLDGSGRHAVSADLLEPSDVTEINLGRASLGLPVTSDKAHDA